MLDIPTALESVRSLAMQKGYINITNQQLHCCIAISQAAGQLL